MSDIAKDKAVSGPSEDLERSYQEIVAKLPTRAPIFLPTERMDVVDRLAGVKRVRHIYDTRLDQVYRPKLKALRDKFVGHDRCFVIGNGPSLNRTDLAMLRNEVTFAVNGFFLKSRELDWHPTFYVVEDHLVAEDRREWINAFKGPTKLFPAYLGYCIDEADDTIFFNHRPRVSYPHGFDFSRDAARITYAGCTVTYTCLQLAHYLGFKETYLIGVDADYELPKDVEQSKSYGVGVLDMKSDDPNHFHPDYFGKGFRWHDPQVNKMVEAYGEARRVVDSTDQRIYNAGVGGRLEVFERRSFQSIFPRARTPVELDRLAADKAATAAKGQRATDLTALYRDAPRLLLIDHTRIGDGTATGEVKQAILRDWPTARLLQLSQAKPDRLALSGAMDVADIPVGAEAVSASLKAAIAKFRPELVLYRPVPRTAALHKAAMGLIDDLGVPVATWIMDDWPSSSEVLASSDGPQLINDFRTLLARSTARLSIGKSMSTAFEARYGMSFEPFANGVERDEWQRPRPHPPRAFTVRYAGSLADNMVLDSIVRLAEAVERLVQDGIKAEFQIKTRPLWHKRGAHLFSKFKHTSFLLDDLSPEDYRAWIAEGDVITIAYNFDRKSIDYIRYSVANKLPECLASGAVLLAHGPAEVATLRLLDEAKCAVLVTDPDVSAIVTELKKLAASPFRRLDLAEAAQDWVFTNCNLVDIRARFLRSMSAAARAVTPSVAATAVPELPRSDHAHVDETGVVAHMLSDRKGRQHVMLDVGAHFGGSAHYFNQLGWTIHCFEPDPSNREKLVKRFGQAPNITIDTRAVSDKPATGVSFFTSEESTGISGLHAFRDTHSQTGLVDVTTVTHIIADKELKKVDFLKIDVEGFDFSVLKGVPWDKIKPDVVECEFEDAKTVPLGHTYKEVAEFLLSKGYAVYLSEWHPIIRYGIRHDWRRVVRYPGIELPSDAWGNIVAFLDDPGLAAVQAGFDALIKKSPDQPATKAAAPPAPQAAKPATPVAAVAKPVNGNGAAAAPRSTMAPVVAPSAVAKQPTPAVAATTLAKAGNGADTRPQAAGLVGVPPVRSAMVAPPVAKTQPVLPAGNPLPVNPTQPVGTPFAAASSPFQPGATTPPPRAPRQVPARKLDRNVDIARRKVVRSLGSAVDLFVDTPEKELGGSAPSRLPEAQRLDAPVREEPATANPIVVEPATLSNEASPSGIPAALLASMLVIGALAMLALMMQGLDGVLGGLSATSAGALGLALVALLSGAALYLLSRRIDALQNAGETRVSHLVSAVQASVAKAELATTGLTAKLAGSLGDTRSSTQALIDAERSKRQLAERRFDEALDQIRTASAASLAEARQLASAEFAAELRRHSADIEAVISERLRKFDAEHAEQRRISSAAAERVASALASIEARASATNSRLEGLDSRIGAARRELEKADADVLGKLAALERAVGSVGGDQLSTLRNSVRDLELRFEQRHKELGNSLQSTLGLLDGHVSEVKGIDQVRSRVAEVDRRQDAAIGAVQAELQILRQAISGQAAAGLQAENRLAQKLTSEVSNAAARFADSERRHSMLRGEVQAGRETLATQAAAVSAIEKRLADAVTKVDQTQSALLARLTGLESKGLIGKADMAALEQHLVKGVAAKAAESLDKLAKTDAIVADIANQLSGLKGQLGVRDEASVKQDKRLSDAIEKQGGELRAIEARVAKSLDFAVEQSAARLASSEKRLDELRAALAEAKTDASKRAGENEALEKRLKQAVTAQIAEIAARIQAQQAEISKHTAELTAIEARIAKSMDVAVEKQRADLAARIHAQQAEISKHTAELTAIEARIAKSMDVAVEKQRADLAARIHAQQAEVSKHTSELTAIEARIAKSIDVAVEKQRADLAARIQTQQAEIAKHTAELTAIETRIAKSMDVAVEKRLEELRSGLVEAKSELAKRAGENEALEKRLQQAIASQVSDIAAKVASDLPQLEQRVAGALASKGQLHNDVQSLIGRVKLHEDVGKDVGGKVASLAEKIDTLMRREGELAAKIEQYAQSLDPIKKQVELLKQESAKSAEATSEALAQLRDPAVLDKVLNPIVYQPFNRRIGPEHVKTLETNWLRRLSVPMSRSALGYMAHRIKQIEGRLNGRLATSIEDAMLRSLVVKAVKGAEVDILEIGTLFGIGAAMLHAAAQGPGRRAHLTLIDPLHGYYDGAALDATTQLPINRETVMMNMRLAGIPDADVTLIDRLSTDPDAIAAAEKREYDVLVIDGDHSFAGVGADFAAYAPMVKLGGYVIFDDYNKNDWPDIKRFVDSEMPKHPWCMPVGSEWGTAVFRVARRPSEAQTTAPAPTPVSGWR